MSDSKQSEGSPMAMGMGMAKKMMAQMGEMHEAGKSPPMDKMMAMCMGMCSEMLNAIRETSALAVHATPELQQTFGEWLKALEGKAEILVRQSPVDTMALAKALNVTEASANYLLARLAQSGKITLVGRARN